MRIVGLVGHSPPAAPESRRTSQQGTYRYDIAHGRDLMSHTEDQDLSRKKCKVKRKVARHAAKRARIAAGQQDSGPSKTHAPDSIAH